MDGTGTKSHTMFINPLVYFNVSSFLERFSINSMQFQNVVVNVALYNDMEKCTLKNVMETKNFWVQEEQHSSDCFINFRFGNKPAAEPASREPGSWCRYIDFFHRIPAPSFSSPILAASDTTCLIKPVFRQLPTLNLAQIWGNSKFVKGLLTKCDPNPISVDQRYHQFWFLDRCPSAGGSDSVRI